MARMIPDIDPETINNSGERAVYIELRDQLPKKWVVRHHFPFCIKTSYLQEKEADFIVLAPERGLMVLEVKGSAGYESSGGIWYRIKRDGTREATGNPFEQAMSTKHKLVEWLAKKACGVAKNDFPGIFGHLVVYPFGKFTNAVGPTAEPAVMLNYTDMKLIHDRLENAFAVWGMPLRARMFTSEVMQKVERCITDDIKLVPILSAQVQQDNRIIEALTQTQFAAFRGVMGNRRVHVHGGAGSGKTLLAFWAATALAAKGERVLFVCFNRVLASWLARRPDSQTITVMSFHALAHETISKASIPFTPPDETDVDAREEFFANEAPALFAQAIDLLDEHQLPRYDAVIIDEGQDFHPDWWFPIQLLLKDPDQGRLCIFSDPAQAGVYGREVGYPAPMTQYQLQENCRNSQRIAQYCGNVLRRKLDCYPTSPTGVFPLILNTLTDATQRAQLVRRTVSELFQQGFNASQIAILSPYRRTSRHSALSYIPEINMKPLRGGAEDLAAWSAEKIIWASSIAAFKGLEAECVIITDVPSTTENAHFTLSDAYVAGSRAKYHLIIVPVSLASSSEQIIWAIGN